jgi:uncharacterized membrane protein
MLRLLLFYLFLSFILFVSIEFISCKDTQTNPTSGIFPASNVSFSNNVEPLFQQKCASSSCHGGGSQNTSGLDLEYPSYTALLAPPGLVIAGDANHSTLVQHLEGSLSPMPPHNFPQLTQNQITGIKTWINEGAKDN